MFKDNKIIIVDNEEKELKTLATVFWKEGIACKALEYDGFYSKPLKGVRVAFFDVNLTSSLAPTSEFYDYNSDPGLKDIFHQLAIALTCYIAKDNGPYALIFWTNNQRLVNNFKVFMDERISDYDVPVPVNIECIDKTDFLKSDLSEDEGLYSKICQLIHDSPINLLYDLEKKANQAVTNTINDIHSITLDDACSWQKPNNNLKKTFIKIAESTIGRKHIKNRLGEGIISGLNPMINFHMEQLISNQSWNDLFPINDSEIQSISLDSEKKYKLNTIFHINNNANRCERGSVYACSSDLINRYIGKKNEPNDWIRQLINFKLELDTEEKAQVQNIIKNSQIIAVELSPACDYSQNKNRLLKFILGIKTNEIDDRLLSTIPAYSFFPKILMKPRDDSEQTFQLIFNFNYTVSLPKPLSVNTDESIGDLLFSLKKDYMDMLTTKYANHISRIGITEFK